MAVCTKPDRERYQRERSVCNRVHQNSSAVCTNIHFHLQAQQEVAQVHSEVRGAHEKKPPEADGRVRRKEKKKKPKKVSSDINSYSQSD